MAASAASRFRLTPTFMVVAGLFITCLITAIIIFPLSYIIGDILRAPFSKARANRHSGESMPSCPDTGAGIQKWPEQV